MPTIFPFKSWRYNPKVVPDLKEQPRPQVRFGLYHQSSDTSWVLEFNRFELIKEIFPGKSEAYQQLDVNILHHLVLKEVLGLDTKIQGNLGKISFIRGHQSPVTMMAGRHYTGYICPI